MELQEYVLSYMNTLKSEIIMVKFLLVYRIKLFQALFISHIKYCSLLALLLSCTFYFFMQGYEYLFASDILYYADY